MMILRILPLLILMLPLRASGHEWIFGPLRDQNGNLFSEGGGVDVVLDLTFSSVLNQYLMALRSNDGSLMILGSGDGQRWATLASETWSWGHNTGTAVANGEALLLLIGNGVFRWPYTTWSRTRINPFVGNLESIAVSGPRVALAGWSTGRVYYSSDWGSSFAEGFASAGMEFLATSDGSFWGTQSYNTNNDTLLESADGTFFSIGSSLPEDVYHVKGLLGMGSRLVLISSGYGPDNKLRFAIYSKLRNQDFVFHGYFNETPSFSPWAMKSDSTERGAIIALPQRGVIEIIVSSTDVNITAREDAQFNLDWRGAAIGIQDCVMVTESGVVATAQLDLRSSNPDLDEDGVEDQYETGTGVYVSPTDTGTSPVDMDSDDDGFSDGYELANDTNPNLSNDTPPTDQAWVRLAVEFSFAAPLGQTFRVEGSDNMTDWTAIETGVQGNGGMGTRLYSTKGQQKQFYRAVTE